MRMLHTSDWHLGRSLHGLSLIDAQRDAVQQLCQYARDEHVDVFLIAGDVFDRAVPSVQALRILDQAVTTLAEAGIEIVLMAGNHDSGDRLSMYSSVMGPRLHLVGHVDQLDRPLLINDAFSDDSGPVGLYAIPYLEPDFARDQLSDQEPLPRSHQAIMQAAVERIRADIAERGLRRVIIAAHAFVTAAGQAQVTDSERDLSIGGVQAIDASILSSQADYVALGHLHRPQELSATVRYCGSLLRYSFSEAHHDKSCCIVDIGAPGQPVSVRTLQIAQPRPMSRLSGSMSQLCGMAYADARDHFVELTVCESTMPERMHAQLDAVFPFALRKQFQSIGQRVDQGRRGDGRGQDPVQTVVSFLKSAGALESGDEDLVRAVVEQVREQ